MLRRLTIICDLQLSTEQQSRQCTYCLYCEWSCTDRDYFWNARLDGNRCFKHIDADVFCEMLLEGLGEESLFDASLGVTRGYGLVQKCLVGSGGWGRSGERSRDQYAFQCLPAKFIVLTLLKSLFSWLNWMLLLLNSSPLEIKAVSPFLFNSTVMEETWPTTCTVSTQTRDNRIVSEVSFPIYSRHLNVYPLFCYSIKCFSSQVWWWRDNG